MGSAPILSSNAFGHAQSPAAAVRATPDGQDWQEVQEGVEVKVVSGPEGPEVFVLARSPDRRQKEQAMHQRLRERIEAALQKMQQSAATGRRKDLAVAQRRWGRLEQRPWRYQEGLFTSPIA